MFDWLFGRKKQRPVQDEEVEKTPSISVEEAKHVVSQLHLFLFDHGGQSGAPTFRFNGFIVIEVDDDNDSSSYTVYREKKHYLPQPPNYVGEFLFSMHHIRSSIELPDVELFPKVLEVIALLREQMRTYSVTPPKPEGFPGRSTKFMYKEYEPDLQSEVQEG